MFEVRIGFESQMIVEYYTQTLPRYVHVGNLGTLDLQ